MVPRLNFKFDKDMDLWNIWDTCQKKEGWHDFSRWMPKDLVKKMKNKGKTSGKQIANEYYSKIYKRDFVFISMDAVKHAWSKIETEYFCRLEKITKKKFKTKKINAYMTLSLRCPYNYDKKQWFMIGFWDSLHNQLYTIGHELMHFHFFDNYSNIYKKLGREKGENLKEALTVILNFEFGDLWFCEDRGYSAHKKLRQFISKEWEKEKDFDLLLNKCVKWLGKK